MSQTFTTFAALLCALVCVLQAIIVYRQSVTIRRMVEDLGCSEDDKNTMPT